MSAQRLLFDVTYTRGQAEIVGITRTVRRLWEEYESGDFPQAGVVAVAGGRFRHAQRRTSAPGAPARPESWLLRAIRSRLGKAAVSTLVRLPWPLVRPLVELAAERAYPETGEPAVRWQPGDVLFLCDASWNYAVWRAASRARAEGAKVVTFIHDLMPLRRPDFVAPEVVGLFRGWLLEMLDGSDALVCNSGATEDDLREWAGSAGVALPPTSHVRLGSDVAAARPAGPVRTPLDGFLSAQPCFAAVGSFEPKKNYGMLLQAFDRLWSEGGEARLVIAGRVSPEWSRLFETVRAHPEHGRRLLAITDATDAEITALYRRSRALVFPSLLEGFGLPLVEARTEGCVVIASDLPVFRELADEGVVIYDRHSRDALCDALRAMCAVDRRGSVPPMRPHRWRDTARQAVTVIEGLLGARS